MQSTPPKAASLSTEGRFVPIREEVIRQCEVLIAETTRWLFRPNEEAVHKAYAKGYVAEVARRLNLKATSLVSRERCLKGVALCFVREAQLYKRSTSLYTEFGFMFEVIEEYLKGKRRDGEEEEVEDDKEEEEEE